MNDYNMILTMITQIGFPIVAFILMYNLVTTTIKDNTKAIQDLTCYLRENKK